MEQNNFIEKTHNYIKTVQIAEWSGHDYWHSYRVWRMAQHIMRSEKNVNYLVIELAALLHDIADWKSNEGDEEIGPQKARDWMQSIGVENEIIEKVAEAIKETSFKGSGDILKPGTKESMVVQDADRLDAIGAIGIARGFMFAGHKDLPMYDPDIKPIENMNEEQYKDLNRRSYTQINHFYEKLLLLKNLMNTETARKIAVERHKFMEEYLDRFYKEWEGKA
jgi:uncharacterized protein